MIIFAVLALLAACDIAIFWAIIVANIVRLLVKGT
jgi:hypothetical protein